ncbi:MAG: helix-turn-helix domain-containing protein [Tepidiformaceae bacterium]
MEIGNTLRAARTRLGLTIDEVAQETRIPARFVEALEDDAFHELPAPVYVRGFLRSYASFLRVDSAPLLAALAEASGAPLGGLDNFVAGVPGATRPQPRDPFTSPTLTPHPANAAPSPPWPDDGDGEYGSRRESSGYRVRRVPGLLVERQPADDGHGLRTIAISAAAVVGVIVLALVAVLLTAGGDDNSVADALPGETASPGPRTVVPVGSATPRAGASASAAAASLTATATAAAATTPAASPTAAAEATPTEAVSTATPPATAAPAATPTQPPTQPPNPTPAPTTQIHPQRFDECTPGASAGVYDCGQPPLRIICAPDGWFVDVVPYFAKPAEWAEFAVDRSGQAPSACPR